MTIHPHDTKRLRGASRLWLAVLAAVLVSMSGCGDDPPPRQSTAPADTKSKQQRGRRGAQKKDGGGVQVYRKVEEFAATPEEASKIRHLFSPKDFEADPTGEENRDPFRSYVVRQPGQQNRGQVAATTVTDICTSKNIVAPRYPLRDLRLIGIVLRGTSSYALFRDSASYGHIVRKGDCLGQEKARVAAIRAGFVSLEVLPEVSPNQTTREPQERAIQLYPEELAIEPSE